MRGAWEIFVCPAYLFLKCLITSLDPYCFPLWGYKVLSPQENKASFTTSWCSSTFKLVTFWLPYGSTRAALHFSYLESLILHGFSLSLFPTPHRACDKILFGIIKNKRINEFFPCSTVWRSVCMYWHPGCLAWANSCHCIGLFIS